MTQSLMKRCFSGIFGQKNMSSHLHRGSAGLHVSLSSFRVHMNTAPPVQALLLHDLFQNGQVWQQMTHEVIGSLPLEGYNFVEPLELYCPDLRGHGKSDNLPVDSKSYIEDAVSDIVNILPGVIGRDVTPQIEREQPLHLCGMGFGAMLACQLALKYPGLFSSLFLILQDIPQLYNCKTGSYPTLPMLRSLQGKMDNLANLNEKLKSIESLDAAQRSLVLANTKKGTDSNLYFRVPDTLLHEEKSFTCSCFDESSTSIFNGSTFVLHQSAFDDANAKAFIEKFPNCRFASMDSKDDDKVARLMVASFGMIEETDAVKEEDAASG